MTLQIDCTDQSLTEMPDQGKVGSPEDYLPGSGFLTSNGIFPHWFTSPQNH